MSGTYSFIDVQASIVGPGGAFSLGYGEATAEEGITIAAANDNRALAGHRNLIVVEQLESGLGRTWVERRQAEVETPNAGRRNSVYVLFGGNGRDHVEGVDVRW